MAITPHAAGDGDEIVYITRTLLNKILAELDRLGGKIDGVTGFALNSADRLVIGKESAPRQSRPFIPEFRILRPYEAISTGAGKPTGFWKARVVINPSDDIDTRVPIDGDEGILQDVYPDMDVIMLNSAEADLTGFKTQRLVMAMFLRQNSSDAEDQPGKQLYIGFSLLAKLCQD